MLAKIIIILSLIVVVTSSNPIGKWVRTNPTNLEWHSEDNIGDIVSITMSVNQQFIVSCSSSGYANFYRVLMYPNHYPDSFSHLYYAKLSMFLEPNTTVIDCELTSDANHLLVLTSSGVYLDFVQGEYGHSADGRNRWKWASSEPFWHLNEYQNVTGFHVVHPRDEYEEMWALSSTFDSLPSTYAKPIATPMSTPIFMGKRVAKHDDMVAVLNNEEFVQLYKSNVMIGEKGVNGCHQVVFYPPNQGDMVLGLGCSDGWFKCSFDNGIECESVIKINNVSTWSVTPSLIVGIEDKKVHLWHNGHSELHFDDDVTAVHVYGFKYWSMVIGVGSKLLVWRELHPSVPNSMNMSRITSFYEPIPPIYVSGAEFDGILMHPYSLLMVVCAILLSTVGIIWWKRMDSIVSFDVKLATWDKIMGVWMVILCSMSLFEIIAQPAFVNDWPAHLHHIEQWLTGSPDYGSMMHYHGPNTYPGGFNWLYRVLNIVTGESLQSYQLVWTLLELGHGYLLYHLATRRLNMPGWLGILPLLSNRLHLYNVRVVVNDFPGVALMSLVMWLMTSDNLIGAACVFGVTLANKLSFVFYAPAFVLIYWLEMGFIKAVGAGFVALATMVCLSIPFIVVNPMSYIITAFDLSRELLWEKTRNMKFVGRVMYSSHWFSTLLLSLSVLLLIVLAIKLRRNWPRKLLYRRQWRVACLVIINYAFIPLSRGLYTPFMCWYFYTFPFVLYYAGIPSSLSISLWISHEVLFRFFGDHYIEQWTTLLYLCTNLIVCLRLLGGKAFKGLSS